MLVNFDCQYDRGVAWKPDGWKLKPFRQQITTLTHLRLLIDEVRMSNCYGLTSGDMSDPVIDGVDIANSIWSVATRLAAHVPGAAAAMPVMPAPNCWFEDGLRYHNLFNKACLNQSLQELSEWAICWSPSPWTGPAPAGPAAMPGAPAMQMAAVAGNLPLPVFMPQQALAVATPPASPRTVALADRNSSQTSNGADAVRPATMSDPVPLAPPPLKKGVMKQGPTTWEIHFGDESASVTNNVNIRRVAVLLSRPGQPVTDTDLVGNVGSKDAKSSEFLEALVDAEIADDQPRPRRQFRQEPVDSIMDTECLKALRRRLAEAKVEHERLIKNNDHRRAEDTLREIEVIQTELSNAVDVFGNQRTFQATGAAKNRRNVQISLMRAYAAFKEHGLHGVAAYLEASIHRRNGAFVYEPGPGNPDWEITFL